ncbi:MAG: ABC transporter substrate-binding protein [Candidatus Tectomicrobia bacterium]|nr:ABC transporter substrate-binding protein [Candidatus Tectomicrobia bacterium]
MQQKFRFMVVILAVVALMMSAHSAAAKLMGTEVKIGYINPFTGWGSPLGKDNEIAVELAMEDINAAGGIGGLPLKIFKYDDASRQEQAINLMRRVANSDKVLGVLGPYISALCEVAFPVANRIGIVAVSSASAAPGITERNRPWTFRNVLTSERLHEPAFKSWIERYNIKRLAMAYDSADFLSKTEATTVFPGIFKKYGVEVVTQQTFQTGNLDFSPQGVAIKASNAEGVVMPALHYEASNMARELRRIEVKVPLYVGIGSISPAYTRLGKAAVEGTMAAQSFWPDNPDPRVQSFVKRYKERAAGKVPPHYSANIYDNLFIMKDAIEKNGVTNDPAKLAEDRAKIRDWWTNLKDYKGVSGMSSMQPNGDMAKEIYIMEVKNGEWTNLKK